MSGIELERFISDHALEVRVYTSPQETNMTHESHFSYSVFLTVALLTT